MITNQTDKIWCIFRDSQAFYSETTHSHISSQTQSSFTISPSSNAYVFYCARGCYFQIKNVESIYHWHQRKAIFWNLAPSKTQNLSVHSYNSHVNNYQILVGLMISKAKIILEYSYSMISICFTVYFQIFSKRTTTESAKVGLSKNAIKTINNTFQKTILILYQKLA